MCGIVGFMGQFDRQLLERMRDSVSHRGPDDEGICLLEAEGVGLGHKRLSIIDISSAGHQPMWNSTGNVAIVFNGEIYNFLEIRKDLEASGYSFIGHSDTEVLLKGYLHFGHSILDKLNGIFAFSIWDGRTKELFLARDSAGVKPLYYSCNGKGFLFASELKALLLEPSIDTAVNGHALLSHLTHLWSPAPLTLMRGVQKLEPGTALIVRERKIAKQWQFYTPSLGGGEAYTDFEDARVAVRNAIEVATRRQLVADVKVGAFLSGGLDSSAVVAFAARHAGRQNLECFTISLAANDALADGMEDDLPYARRIAQEIGVKLHEVRAGPEMADELEKMIYHLDEPNADFSAWNVMLIARLARQCGVKVLLSGVGGDEIFAGYRRHRALLAEDYWTWLPLSVRRLIARRAESLPANGVHLRRIKKILEHAHFSDDERLLSYFHWLAPSVAHDLMTEEFSGETVELGKMSESLQSLDVSASPLRKLLFLEQRYYLPDHNLLYMDRMSMAAGVEVRVPLLDPDVVALDASIRPASVSLTSLPTASG